MSAIGKFALAPRRPLPGRTGPLFWTGQDYTGDPKRALPFVSVDAANRWLNVHKHLRAGMVVVEVVEKPEGKS